MDKRMINRLCLLLLFDSVEKIKSIAQLQGFVFILESEERKLGRHCAFNYKFIRWLYGPYSKELIDDIEFLLKKELVETINKEYKLSEKGKQIMIQSRDMLKLYWGFHPSVIDNLLKFWCNKSLKELLKNIYSFYNVKEYKMGKIIEDEKYIIKK